VGRLEDAACVATAAWPRHYAYDPKPLQKHLYAVFEDRIIGSATRRLCIPSFDGFTEVHIFKTPHHKDYKKDWRDTLVTAAMATAAAPTFFPVYKDRGRFFADGGVWANNPVMIGLVDALACHHALLGCGAASANMGRTRGRDADQTSHTAASGGRDLLTGELRNKIDRIWDAFWAGGIANPLEVIEQITYLLFIRGLDDVQIREENKAVRLKQPIERRIFPEGKDEIGKGGGLPYEEMRWSRFRNKAPAEMFDIVSDHVFPFIRSMADAETAHAAHMKGARFTIPTPGLLAKVVDLLADIPMEDRDTKGDLYEYMLSKIASAGQNGQFRTPRHIIALMVEMMAPGPKDTICDPAAGTCGFLVAAGEYLRDNHPEIFRDEALRRHFHEGMFHGFDFDGTMLRIGSMNMLLHGIENPDVRYKDSLAHETMAATPTATASSSPIRRSPARSTTRRRRRTCSRSSRRRRPSFCSSPCSSSS
jgi:hypothetical protein